MQVICSIISIQKMIVPFYPSYFKISISSIISDTFKCFI